MCDWVKYAKAGDPVVCVRTGGHRYTKPLNAGTVYLVRRIEVAKEPATDAGVIGVLLEGVINKIQYCTGEEYAYLPERFRPATSTDLPASIREALKTPAPKEKANV